MSDAFLIEFGKETYVLFSEGFYRLRVSRIDLIQGRYGPAFEIQFEALDKRYRGCYIKSRINKSLDGRYGSKHKMGQWSAILNKKQSLPGQKINLQTLIGKTCLAYIKLKFFSSRPPSNNIEYLEEDLNDNENS